MSDMITVSSPFSRPLHFLVLELAVLACTVLVLGHAVGAYRRGDRRHLFQWLVITFYGVQMELIAFNFLHNYEHAQFTVQFYDNQLPLYVTGLYGSFMYTGLKLVERLHVHPVVEALLAGFAMALIDVPFDIAGAALGWWTWLDTDPNLAFRWLGVPVTSYYWYLAFGAVAAAQCRLLWPRLERRPFGVAVVVAMFAGFGVIFFGVLAFLPFHGGAALGLSHGALVALHLAICAVLALSMPGRGGPPDRAVALAVALVPGTCTLVLVWAAAAGRLDHTGEQVGYALASLLGLVALLTFLPLRRPAVPPVPVAAR